MAQLTDIEKEIIDFFNYVTASGEIVNKIRDDPG